MQPEEEKKLTETEAWEKLKVHYEKVKEVEMRDLFAKDSNRFSNFSLLLEDILFDFSKNRITEETLQLLLQLAKQQQVEEWRNKMFAGEKINFTEQRAVLHVALRNRGNKPIVVDGENKNFFKIMLFFFEYSLKKKLTIC